ncbi:MAG TPA: class I SAM-dependent methyltransferase [Acidimicrobiales bacterium]|jgi:SAM-dependent methyltransferase|nr:class I SAM-dependent methyltransferase [Acidimicrobiales bacterium]
MASTDSPDSSTHTPLDAVSYGPDIGTEAELRLLGDLKGKRVLELGCGGAQAAVAFARQGATTIAIDTSAEQLELARKLVEREGVRVELRQGDLAELAFLRADSIDLIFSAQTLALVEDLRRVLRQAHRVLKVGAPLVFSLPHPAYAMVDADDPDQPLLIRRSYFDRTPVNHERGGVGFTTFPRTVADVFWALHRSSYRVDTLLEPEPPATGPRSQDWRQACRYVPRTLVVRARKEGL